MVKGVTKRVVVVRCPDTKYFDQAIFMVREDAMDGRSPEHVLEEACRVADSYIRENVEKRKFRWQYAVGAVGALGIAVLILGLWIM